MKNYETMSIELVRFESREDVMIDAGPNVAPAPVRSGAAPAAAPTRAPGTAVAPIN